MLRLLIILGVGLYSVLLIAGEDKGQLRAGLRDVPAVTPTRPDPVVAQAPPPAAEPAPEAKVAVTLASLPAQPIRVQPPPQEPVMATNDQPTLAAEDDTVVADDPLPNTALAWVAVDRANVRLAPSRQASVTGRVERGEALLVLWTEPSGWVRVRVEGDGVDGFVHESLLSDTAPAQ